jgi:hypothetical protein
MSPQDFLEMDDGEAICFIGKKIKPFRIISMDTRRHPQLKKRIGITPPDQAKAPPLASSAPATPPKPTPLQTWHFDPQLFRKWPQMTESGGEGENLQEQTEVHEVSLGL